MQNQLQAVTEPGRVAVATATRPGSARAERAGRQPLGPVDGDAHLGAVAVGLDPFEEPRTATRLAGHA